MKPKLTIQALALLSAVASVTGPLAFAQQVEQVKKDDPPKVEEPKVAPVEAKQAEAKPADASGQPKPQAKPASGKPAQAKPGQAQPAKGAPVPMGPDGKPLKIDPKTGKPIIPKAWGDFLKGNKSNIFLDFTEANPTSVFNLLSRASGITIIKDPSFKTKLTLATGKEVPLEKAFDVVNNVLNFSGYEFQKQGDYLYVQRIPPPPRPPMMPPPPQPDTKPITKVIRLKNESAGLAVRIINEVFGEAKPAGGFPGMPGMPPGMQPGMMQGGGGGEQQGGPGENSPVKASADDYGNAVIITTSPQRMPKVEALLAELDKPTDVVLESEVFKLNHVSVDEALPVVKELLVSRSPVGAGQRSDSNDGGNPFFFFFSSRQQTKKGSETAVAVKQTNSIIVTATKANLEAVKKLLASLDVPSNLVGTTFVIPLQNAKASDVASLLNEVFKLRRNGQDDRSFFFFGDFNGGDIDKTPTSDTGEDGKVTNIRDLSGKVTIAADPNTNSIIVTTLPSNVKFVEGVIKQLDKSPQQVMIETIIVEATLDKTTKLGTEWSFLKSKALDGRAFVDGTQNFGVKPATGTAQGSSFTITGATYNAFINLLQTDNRFKVLSTPRIVTSNNVKSQINVSQKVPYVVSTQTNNNGVQTFNYQFLDVGIILDVTPRVTMNNMVAMDVTQTANELEGFTTFQAPIVNNRSAQATVSVEDGQTIVLGGIIRNTQRVNETKVPIVGDLPLIGNLFKNSSNQVVQTELMVFLTPHIIRNGDDIKKLREASERELSKGTRKATQDAIKTQEGSKGGG